MKKSKIGMVVEVPKNTLFLKWTGSVLDLKLACRRFKYVAYAKVISDLRTINEHKNMVNIDVWDPGRSFPWCCAVPFRCLRESQAVLGYNEKKDQLWVLPMGYLGSDR